MPAFSVVLPAYDAEAFITQALDSVGAQSEGDYEIVVLDDGSRDGTSEAVRRWHAQHDARSLRLHAQDNRGIGAARNAAIAHADGQWIAFLDADDLWLPPKLARVRAFLARHPDVDLVCHDEWLVDGSGTRRRLRHGPHTRYHDLLFKGNVLSTSATVVRSASVRAVGGFPEDLRYNGHEDYDLWLRLARSGCRFAYLHEILGHYRVHAGGITSRAEEHCVNGLNVLEAHYRTLPAPRMRERYSIRRRRAATIRGAVRTLLRQRDERAARRLLALAAREDPLSLKTWALGASVLARLGS
jgi:glycosyltransferase involved in cell wall biosynthesis